MKKIYSLVLMAAALLIGTGAWAATPVAGTTGADLQNAINAAASGDVLQLQDNIIITQGSPIWLGSTTVDGAFKSIELDLNGHNITCTGAKSSVTIGKNTYSNVTCPVYMFVLSHGELKITNSSAQTALIKQDGTASEGSQIFSVYGTYAVKKENGEYVNTWENGYFSHLVIGENVIITGNIGTGIGVDVIYKSTGSASNNGTLSVHPLMQASGNTVDYITNIFYGYGTSTKAPLTRYNGSDASGGYGYAYGVRVDVYGTIDLSGTSKTYGMKVNGMVETPTKPINSDKNKVLRKETKNTVLTTPLEGTVMSDPSSYAYVASYTESVSDTACAPFIHVHETAHIYSSANVAKSTAVYSSGWAKWLIEGECKGATGVNIKAGKLFIQGATIASNATTYVAPSNAGGASGTGSAIVVNSTTAYSGDVAVTISGNSTITGTTGYAIEEAVNTPIDPNTNEKETKVDNIVIEGGTIVGGDKGAIIITEETVKDPEADVVVYGGDITGSTQAATSGDLDDLTPATGYHTTEVTVNGKTTIVVSQGDGPVLANSVIGADQYAAIKWQNAGTTAETLNKDLTLTELEINEDYAQTLTVAAGKKLIVGHVILGANAKIIVKPGAKFIVTDKDGIATQTVNNIVLESSETAQAVLLMNPAVTNHTNPKATVEMTVLKGMEGSDNAWTRFAMPLQTLSSLKRKHAYETWIYGWDYTAKGGQGDWALLANVNDMKSWIGYTLSYANAGEQVYTFEGNLAGNANAPLKFVHKGYNYFGNSYSSFIDAKTLVENLPADVDGSIWMWDVVGQEFKSVPMNLLKEHPERLDAEWMKDVPPMTTFILRLMDKDNAAASVDYASAIWSNPRYGNAAASSSNPAPARASMENAYIKMIVTAANGKSDRINLTENAAFSDAYDRGYDAAKYMNENGINFYATINGEDYSDVTTNNLEGKTISLQTNDEIAYTISFKNVEGNEYALLDKVANQVIAIEEGATYEFAAQPNTTIEGRFEIVAANKVATAIENTEVKANVKGIYTITGQYVGENFDVLPAGVYVVDGVKIIK